jgi:hypothetical protein
MGGRDITPFPYMFTGSSKTYGMTYPCGLSPVRYAGKPDTKPFIARTRLRGDFKTWTELGNEILFEKS